MSRIVAVVVGLAGTAAAQPADDRVGEVASLLRTAHEAATAGRCEQVRLLGEQVRDIMPDAAIGFTTDPVLTVCLDRTDDKSVALASLITIAGSTAGVVGGTIVAIESVDDHSGGGFVRGVGYTTAAAMFAFGPSLGHAYVGDPWNWWLALRLAGIGAFAVGVGVDAIGLTPKEDGGPREGAGLGLLVGGLAYTVGLIGENVATPVAAATYNERRAGHDLVIAPLRNGLAIAGRF